MSETLIGLAAWGAIIGFLIAAVPDWWRRIEDRYRHPPSAIYFRERPGFGRKISKAKLGRKPPSQDGDRG